MLGIRPTKTLGQNFEIDPHTIRRIVSAAEISPETVLEVAGPGFVDPRHPGCCEGIWLRLEIDPPLWLSSFRKRLRSSAREGGRY